MNINNQTLSSPGTEGPISEKLLQYRPPRMVMLLLTLATVVHVALPALRPELFSSKVLAVCVAVAGFAIMMWAWWLFQKAETAICPTEYNNALVTSGIYRVSRHPMYLGMVMMMAGAALWFGTLPYYIVNAVFFLVINQVFCPFEEKKLDETFGEEYFNYRRKVRRWV
jgi:protein-S-isoprenylcysteine O-methyltransferase Ste14